MPLAIADPSWDVGRHCCLCLTWMKTEEGKQKEECGELEVGQFRGRKMDRNEGRKGAGWRRGNK